MVRVRAEPFLLRPSIALVDDDHVCCFGCEVTGWRIGSWITYSWPVAVVHRITPQIALVLSSRRLVLVDHLVEKDPVDSRIQRSPLVDVLMDVNFGPFAVAGAGVAENDTTGPYKAIDRGGVVGVPFLART